MRRTRAILLGLFIASLALPPAAWATITTTPGTDGAGLAGALQKDASTVNALHPTGQGRCMETANGATIIWPSGLTTRVDNCATVNMTTATDLIPAATTGTVGVCQLGTGAGNCAAGNDSRFGASGISPPLYTMTAVITGTGSITATASDATSTNTGTRTVTATATGAGTSSGTGTVTGTQTVSGTASATASGTASWTGTVTGIGTGSSTTTETNVSVGNASAAAGMLSIGSSGQAQFDPVGALTLAQLVAGSATRLNSAGLGFNKGSGNVYGSSVYGYAGLLSFTPSNGMFIFGTSNGPGTPGTAYSGVGNTRLTVCPTGASISIGYSTCNSNLLNVGAGGTFPGGFDASANVFAPNIKTTAAVSSIPSTTGGSTTLDPGWLPAATAAAYGAIKLFTGTPSADTYLGAVGSSLLAAPGDHAHPAGYSKGVYVNSGAATVDTTAAATPTGAGQILQTTAAGTAVFAAAPTASGQVAKATATNAWGWAGLAAVDVGLGNVTNDAQTKAAILPNTAPSAGQIPVGNAGGTAYAPTTVSGDATLASTGAVTVKGINGTTMSALSTGLVKNTTGTGVPSIAVAADLPGGPYVPTSTTHLSGDVATSRNVSTTNGLQGGGDLSADRTLSPVYGTTANTVMQGNDSRVVNALQSLPLPYATATGALTGTGTGTATASMTDTSTATLIATATVTGTFTAAGTGTITGTGTHTATGYATLTKTATGTATVTVTGTGTGTSTNTEVNASIGDSAAAAAMMNFGSANQAQWGTDGTETTSSPINMNMAQPSIFGEWGNAGTTLNFGSFGDSRVYIGSNAIYSGGQWRFGNGSHGTKNPLILQLNTGQFSIASAPVFGWDGSPFTPVPMVAFSAALTQIPGLTISSGTATFGSNNISTAGNLSAGNISQTAINYGIVQAGEFGTIDPNYLPPAQLLATPGGDVNVATSGPARAGQACVTTGTGLHASCTYQDVLTANGISVNGVQVCDYLNGQCTATHTATTTGTLYAGAGANFTTGTGTATATSTSCALSGPCTVNITGTATSTATATLAAGNGIGFRTNTTTSTFTSCTLPGACTIVQTSTATGTNTFAWSGAKVSSGANGLTTATAVLTGTDISSAGGLVASAGVNTTCPYPQSILFSGGQATSCTNGSAPLTGGGSTGYMSYWSSPTAEAGTNIPYSNTVGPSFVAGFRAGSSNQLSGYSDGSVSTSGYGQFNGGIYSTAGGTFGGDLSAANAYLSGLSINGHFATPTPAPSSVPISDGSGSLNSWVNGRLLANYYAGNGGDVTTAIDGSWTDLVSLTTNGSGGSVVVTSVASMAAGLLTSCYARITFDGSVIGPTYTVATDPGSSHWVSLSPTAVYPGFSATTHTIKLQVSSVSGNTCVAYAGRSQLVGMHFSP